MQYLKSISFEDEVIMIAYILGIFAIKLIVSKKHKILALLLAVCVIVLIVTSPIDTSRGFIDIIAVMILSIILIPIHKALHNSLKYKGRNK